MYPKTVVLLIFFICILIQSCSSESVNKQDINFNQNPFEHITLIDTFTNKLSPSSLETSYETLIIPPFYIGEDTSEIFLAYNSPTELNPFIFFEGEGIRQQSVLTGNIIDNINLTIYVDTTQFLGNYTLLNHFPPWEDTLIRQNWQPIFGRGNILSYPVFIRNNQSRIAFVGFGTTLSLVLQAQDNNGMWHTVSRSPSYCGGEEDDIRPFYLRSQQISIASCPIYKGNYKTKLRLAYGWSRDNSVNKHRLYSNEFTGYINYDLIH